MAGSAPAQPDLSWHRKAGRRVLRGLRPLAAPFLNRFQQRLQTAIEYSSPVAAIRHMDQRIDMVRTDLQAIGRVEAEILCVLKSLLDRQNSLLDRQELFASFGHQFVIKLERLQLGVDAVRLDLQAADAMIKRQLGGLDSLQQRVDGVRLGLEAADTKMGQQFDSSHRVLDVIRASQLTDVASRQDSDAGMVALASLLRDRADLLLQRVAIPIGADVLVRTPEGFLLVPAEDERLLAAMYEGGGRLEPGTVGVICAILESGDWVVDVGAHIGTTVLPSARRVGPDGRVIAVEPASRVADLLRRSIHLNSFDDRIILHGCAAGAAEGSADLNLGPTTGHSSLLALPEADRRETVRVRPLDALVEPGKRIRLVKLDAEGFELQIWRGMGRVIADNPTLAVVVEFGPAHLRRADVSVEAWLAEIRAPGFTAYEVDETDGCLRPLRDTGELNSVFSINLLLLRQPPASFPSLRFA